MNGNLNALRLHEVPVPNRSLPALLGSDGSCGDRLLFDIPSVGNESVADLFKSIRGIRGDLTQKVVLVGLSCVDAQAQQLQNVENLELLLFRF